MTSSVMSFYFCNWQYIVYCIGLLLGQIGLYSVNKFWYRYENPNKFYAHQFDNINKLEYSNNEKDSKL